MSSQRYLSATETAKVLGLSTTEVIELCVNEELPGAYIRYENGPWRIPANAVEDYLEKEKPLKSANFQGARSMTKPPNVWEWAWNKIPVSLRSFAIVVVLLFLVATAITNLLKNVDDLKPQEPQVTPTLISDWQSSNGGTIHIFKDSYRNYGHCLHGTSAVPSEQLNEIIKASTDELGVLLGKYSLDIAPTALLIRYSQEKRSPFDETIIREMQLEITEYAPLEDTLEIFIFNSPCAGGFFPLERISYLVINPNQRTYDVLRPRITSPNVQGIKLSEPYASFQIDVNALEPGIYHLQLTIYYSINGEELISNPLLFSIIVPELQQVQNVYVSQMGPIDGPKDALPFKETYSEFLKNYIYLEYFANGETLSGLRGPYTYLVNLGHDVELTDWTLKQDNITLFTFPDFILPSGYGVRIWSSDGINSQSDLFGADRVNSKEDNNLAISLHDNHGNQVWLSYVSTNP